MSSIPSSVSSLKSYSSFSTIQATKSGFTSCTTTSSLPSRSSPTPTKAKKIWAAIKQHAKEHHESVNAAYSVYYGQGNGPMARRPEQEQWIGYEMKSEKQDETEGGEEHEKECTARKAWEKVKKHAREHHESVNAAHALYYGGAPMPKVTGQ